MAVWQSELTIITQNLIGDLLEETFTVARIKETIVVAAQLLITEVSFDKSYTINVDEVSISPDPTAVVKDDGFITLVCLKAACILASSEARTYALNSMTVKDGPSSISITSRADAFHTLSKDMCEKYENAKMQYVAGGSRSGVAIVTPVVNEGVSTLPGNFS